MRRKLGEPDLPGVIYFDDNTNNQWNESTEFAFNYCVDKGLSKQIYPPDVTAAMERLKIFLSMPAAARCAHAGSSYQAPAFAGCVVMPGMAPAGAAMDSSELLIATA